LKSIGQIITVILFIILSIGLVILLSPFLVPFFIYSYFKESVFKTDYRHYLQSIEGKKIFCYNSRTNSNSYIKENILPKLTADTEIVYVNGKDPITKLDKKYISHALYSINNKKGFPYLLKVENGKIIDQSINNEFYNTIHQRKDITLLVEKINSFYQTTSADQTN